MRAASYLLTTTPPQQTVGIARKIMPFHRFRRRLPCEKIRRKSTGKELDRETGLYYFGARYLDPRTSRWLSVDPAIWQGDFLPSAPNSEQARRRNANLRGEGGVFNTVNLNVFAYGGNNPIRYVDPDGRAIWKAAAIPVVVGYKAIKAGCISAGVAGAVDMASQFIGSLGSGEFSYNARQTLSAMGGGFVAGVISGGSSNLNKVLGFISDVYGGVSGSVVTTAINNIMEGNPITQGMGENAIIGAISGGLSNLTPIPSPSDSPISQEGMTAGVRASVRELGRHILGEIKDNIISDTVRDTINIFRSTNE